MTPRYGYGLEYYRVAYKPSAGRPSLGCLCVRCGVTKARGECLLGWLAPSNLASSNLAYMYGSPTFSNLAHTCSSLAPSKGAIVQPAIHVSLCHQRRVNLARGQCEYRVKLM